MATRTIRIEIPVEVQDNTSSGTEGVTGNLSKMEQAFQKLEKQAKKYESQLEKIFSNGGSKAEKAFEKATEGKNTEHSVEISADDKATSVLHNVEDTANRVDGISADVEVGTNDNATPTVKSVEDSVESLGGTSASPEIGAEDSASPVIDSVSDKVSSVDGLEASPEIGVEDSASPIIDMIRDKLHAVGGMAVSAVIGAADTASAVIDSITDKLSAFSGKTWNTTVGVIDTVTAPMGKAARMMQNPIAQAAAIGGVSFGLVDTVNTFKDFEQMMSQVKAISGASGAEFDALTEKAKQMGADTKFSAYESAEAFNYMAMAGWKTNDMMGGIEGIMSLAAASGEDLGTTSDIVTDALTAFGLKASDSSHFSDVLAQASANANTNVGLLGESFKYVAPVAGAMNYSIEDTSLALGLMANASIKGSMAGTALKTSIANMASPTDSMAAAMDKYGISLTDNEGNMKSLKGVMDNLRTSMGGLSETEQTAAASTIFGKEAMAGMLAIINASEEDYNKLTEAVYNADGAAQKMADTMMDNLAGSLELLSGAADEVKQTLGERLSPYLRSAADAMAEAMPGIKTGVTQLMDFVDGKAENMKNTISAMTNSKEWMEADFLGKVNIAWDKIVAEPFMDWASGDGVHLLSKGLGGLFSEASKIMPGGQKAGLSSWLSAGIIAKTAVPVIETAKKGISFLADFSPVAGKAGLAAAVAAAGIAAVAVAVDNYNQQQIDDSLEKHFGDIELSAKQAKDFADQLMNVKFTTGIETSLEEFKNAKGFREKAEAALAANDALEWKCSVGLTLTEDEQSDYLANVTTFVESKKEELTSAARAASEGISTVIGGELGNTLNDTIGKWLQADMVEAEQLSSDLTATVEAALTDGIIEVDEQKAISELQTKINNILSGWSGVEAQTQIDMIKQKYGHLTGKDLTDGAFSEIVDSFQSARETKQEEIDALSENFYNLVNGAHNRGRLDDSGVKQWKGWWDQGRLNKEGSALMNALEFETNTLKDTYGYEITGNLEEADARVNKGIKNQMAPLFASEEGFDIMSFQDYLNAGVQNQKGNASGALKKLYETMEPDVSAMGNLMDRFREGYGYVPENLKQAWDEAIEVGAAAGDESAALQTYANNLLKNGGDEIVSALTDPSNPAYDEIRNASPEFAQAIDRALAQTGEGIEIDDLMAKIKELNVDDSEAQQSVEQAMQSFEDSVSKSGSQVEVTAEGVQVTLGDVEVDGQSALEQVAAAVGMTADELAQANEYESAAEVKIGAKITVPSDLINFDTSALEGATQEAAEQADAGTAEMQAGADITVTPENVDTSQVEAATEEQLGGGAESVPATATTDVTAVAGNVDASQAQEQVQSETEAAFSESIPADGQTDVTLTQTNNAAAIYSEVDAQVKSTFAAGFSASAPVAVTLDWSIVNPTANITVGGAGSGSASVSASLHAEGGLFAAPHLGMVAEDGPEAIIPLGAKRRDRGLSLWQQAGRALGVTAYADGGIVGRYSSNSFYDDSDDEGEGESEKTENGKVDVSVDTGRGNVQVSVNLSPSFEINNDDPKTVVQMIRAQLKEMVDELGNEIAEQAAEHFANMPV